jgi:DNA (cytosine-5)-methyltransferase 1
VNVDLRPVNVLALFAGGGGLERGIRLAAPRARVVCAVEVEAYACAALARSMEAGELDACPVWTDVRTFDGRPWRGRVHLVAGGFPCTDLSNAGKQAGIVAGTRSGLWRHFARVVDEVRPPLVFIENVAALAHRGLDHVLADLAALGFDAEWGVFRASDAGAPHQRARLFVLANDASQRRGARGAEHHGAKAARAAGGFCGAVGDADHAGLEGRLLRDGGRTHELTPRPPGPSDTMGWRGFLERWPGAEPAIRRDADGLACRVDRLRLLGNGVDPDQAALAFRTLAARLGD